MSAVQNDRLEVYDWIIRPILMIQLVHYSWGIYRFVKSNTSYEFLRELNDGQNSSVFENHIMTTVVMKKSPNKILIGIHLFMAFIWILGVLIQKETIKYVEENKLIKKIHINSGRFMIFTSIFGIIVGFFMEIFYQGHLGTKIMFCLLPIGFFPLILLTVFFALRKNFEYHRYFANLTFVVPAFASFLADVMIYCFQIFTQVGPGWAIVLGAIFGLVFTLILVPIKSPKIVTPSREKL
eukprot:TRINITY_DN26662_c1_g1_i2.p1 TRINITY_DN26662_c1_g1~~TRINITY_DN26662_c1_g1_i2.p1  ORF type:complete len:238 (-),score=20.67 TRINITY_DN26662_c1_g1_i2:125-838(-)